MYNGSKQLALEESAKPVAKDGEVLIRLHSVGICGSDMHAYLGHDARRPAPLILGHEAAGTVVGGPDDGMRVTVNPLVACGTCVACKAGRQNICPNRQLISMPPREGAFAELVTMPLENVVAISDGTSFEHAGLAEPIACGRHAVRLALRALDAPADQADCLVLGDGAFGLGVALALRAFGVNSVALAEINPLRRAYLKNRNNISVIGPGDPKTTPKLSYHIVIDGVGYASTRPTASDFASPGGVIAHIGLGDAEGGPDIRRMTLLEITFIGTYTYTPEDILATPQTILEGRFGPLDWIQTRRLAEGDSAFKTSKAA